VAERIPGSPPGSPRARAQRGLVLIIATIVATGSLAAAAISNPIHGRVHVGGASPVAVEAGATLPEPVRPPASAAQPGATLRPSSSPPTATAAPRLQQVVTVKPDVAGAYEPPRLTYNGSRRRPAVALTFDDGWSTENARLIFDILQREHVKATFFVNGTWLAKDPAVWKAIADAGFVVGNHTWRHRDVTAMTEAEVIRDLQRNAAAWQAVTGHPMAPLFRPPYGYRDEASDVAAAKAGFPEVILWDAPANDTYAYSDARVYRYATAGRAGSIVLMHMGPDVTPRILARVIASYRRRGFDFVTVPELLPARPPVVPATPPPTDPPPADVREMGLRADS